MGPLTSKQTHRIDEFGLLLYSYVFDLFRVRIFHYHSPSLAPPTPFSPASIEIGGGVVSLFLVRQNTYYILMAGGWLWEYSSTQTMSRAHTFISAWRLVIRVGIRFPRRWWRIAHSWQRRIVLKVFIFERFCSSLFPPLFLLYFPRSFFACFTYFLFFFPSPVCLCFRLE